MERLSVVGLGKLGACFAAVLAHRGFYTVGVDIDKSKVDAINSGKAPVYEPGLRRMLRLAGSKLRATTSIGQAVIDTDATLIIVPTPSTKSGAFTLKYVSAVVRDIGRALRRKSTYHLVVIKSTVMPGSTDGVIVPALEKHSGKKVGKTVGLCYNPEFIALGDAIRGLLHPNFMLIGESDHSAGERLVQIRRRVCLNTPPVARMNFLNSEIAKLALNSYITMKISFANTLAEMCEKLSGADVDIVTNAIGYDRRIGHDFLNGGLGFGGPCFPRDDLAFVRFASRIGAQAFLPEATHRVNEWQVNRLEKLVKSSLTGRRRSVGILGLSYKPGTNVVEASQSVILAKSLAQAGYEVHVHDPVANEAAKVLLGDRVIFESRLENVISKCDVCVIATPWRNFKVADTLLRGKVVIDCWRLFRRNRLGHLGKYAAVGLGPSSQQSGSSLLSVGRAST